ncbi:hypothetical protein [Cupriavidus taiwanensis]|uniref:Uncharacterized protein n=1 Tax=Cupriavidus taiwanensis TaxID=164546 RepID=A0A375J3E9_9BURK|nr:hypothetical protein [Cupriavidus taiwanensis]SPR99309.1 hypothetical protein CBM2634_A80241 [Cupriavidus taiwanensis]
MTNTKKPEAISPEDLNAAADFLRALLAGGPVTVPQAREAARKAGVQMRAVKEAKRALRVRTEPEDPNVVYVWRMPAARGDQERE